MSKERKKLIEVALPLEPINHESAREKSIRHGHPSTLHLWWARRPLAACRAVLFASLVDDPSSVPEEYPTPEAQERERQRLFRLIEELVKWENSNNESVLQQARLEIARSISRSLGRNFSSSTPPEDVNRFLAEDAPPVLDPFCGGGSIPLEAQRLGLRAFAGDLNGVAVLITKALIEIPPKFAGRPPVNPEARAKIGNDNGWRGVQGLAEDVRYYGKWMREQAEKRIGHLYPKVKLSKEHGGGEATVIAWLWARTVKCPNPVCQVEMPLARSFWLSTKKEKKWWIEPVGDQPMKTVRFMVRTGEGMPPDGTVSRNGARCICCKTPVPLDYVRAEGQTGRIGTQLMAIVAESTAGRAYLPPNDEHAATSKQARSKWKPDQELQGKCRVSVPLYGMNTFADLFTSRQLVTLTTFCDLLAEVRDLALRDALAARTRDDAVPLHAGGSGAYAYADAVATYIGLALSKLADYNSSLVVWSQSRDQAKSTFARQAIPMVWDFSEVNPFAGAAGDLAITLDGICEALEHALSSTIAGKVEQRDARTIRPDSKLCIFTDPPYYDNIAYSDLSDFFHIWLRSSLLKIHPDLFSTLLTPKTQELVATPYRFEGDKQKAERFFEEGLKQAFVRMREAQHPDYPLALYYAFKQAESEDEDDEGSTVRVAAVASTGWETMLESLLGAGFAIVGTWPMRTERGGRTIGIGTNALASSIVLVCRPRGIDAPLATRREFVTSLRRELPIALKALQRGNIAPVDLAQASIGPGMAVFSRYAKVLESDGSAMKVRTSLQLINQALDEYLAQQEGEMDADTRWALSWFEQFGMSEGSFGDAETLSKAKNTSVEGMKEAGLLRARGGRVRLLKRDELSDNWDPAADPRLTVWKATQHLIRTLEQGGETAAASLVRRLGGVGDAVRDLAYRLYAVCDRKQWAEEARAYNSLVAAWPRLVELAARVTPTQVPLVFGRER